jgi:hypothetical protein
MLSDRRFYARSTVPPRPITLLCYASDAHLRSYMLRFKAWKRRGMLKTCEGEMKPWQRLFVRRTDAVLSTAPYWLGAMPSRNLQCCRGYEPDSTLRKSPPTPLSRQDMVKGGGRATSYHATGSDFRARATMVGWYSKWAGSLSRCVSGKRCGNARKASWASSRANGAPRQT